MQFQKGDSRSCVHMLRVTGTGQRKVVSRGGLRRVAPSAERLLRRKNTEGACAPTAGACERAVYESRTMQFQKGDSRSCVHMLRTTGTGMWKVVSRGGLRRVAGADLVCGCPSVCLPPFGARIFTAECRRPEGRTMQFQKGDSRSCVHMLRTTGTGMWKVVSRGGLRRVAGADLVCGCPSVCLPPFGARIFTAECRRPEGRTMQFQKGDSRSCVHMLRVTGTGQRKVVSRGGLRRVAPSAERLLRRKNTEGACAPTAGAGEQAVCEGSTMQFQIGDIISSVDVPRIMGTDHRKRVPGRVSRRG